jgi:pimeloyl-ACP methyl ester carboxylesterase
MFSQRLRRAGWFCLIAVVATSCSTTIGGHAVAAHESAPSDVKWGKCHVEGGGGDAPKIPAGTQCGELTVPIDYAKPDAGSAHLALIRFPATEQKIGSLVVNPGGPGESGVDAAVGLLDGLPAPVRQHFDIVGFDPRGVGGSTPALQCNTDAENDADRADTEVDFSPAGVAHIEDTEKQFVQRCLDKMGGEFLANVGTASVVKDLDALRVAVGDDKLTYLGYSYGTLIGSLYAEAYPDHVRAMILDGVVDPNEDPVQAAIAQATGFQKAFDAYATDCAKSADCPLGTDPSAAVDAFHHLIDPLVAQPAHTEDPRGLSYSDAMTGTQMAMYTPTFWKHLTRGLQELAHGQGDTLLKLADAYEGRDGDGHYTNSMDALISINCVDHPAITDRAKVADLDRRLREVAPFESYGTFTGSAPLDYCAFWPVPPTTVPHPVAAHGLPATLEVSTLNDPATPYQAGVEVAKELGGTLLTYDGTQHTVTFQGDQCVDDVATKYLVDLTLPPADTKCS